VRVRSLQRRNGRYKIGRQLAERFVDSNCIQKRRRSRIGGLGFDAGIARHYANRWDNPERSDKRSRPQFDPRIGAELEKRAGSDARERNERGMGRDELFRVLPLLAALSPPPSPPEAESYYSPVRFASDSFFLSFSSPFFAACSSAHEHGRLLILRFFSLPLPLPLSLSLSLSLFSVSVPSPRTLVIYLRVDTDPTERVFPGPTLFFPTFRRDRPGIGGKELRVLAFSLGMLSPGIYVSRERRRGVIDDEAPAGGTIFFRLIHFIRIAAICFADPHRAMPIALLQCAAAGSPGFKVQRASRRVASR